MHSKAIGESDIVFAQAESQVRKTAWDIDAI